MKVKYGHLRSAVDILEKIGTSPELRASISFRLGKVLKTASDELEKIEIERRKAVEKYGVKREDGQFEVTPENLDTYKKEMDELLRLETELPGQKFKPEDFDGVRLSPFDFALIEFMIEG